MRNRLKYWTLIGNKIENDNNVKTWKNYLNSENYQTIII